MVLFKSWIFSRPATFYLTAQSSWTLDTKRHFIITIDMIASYFTMLIYYQRTIEIYIHAKMSQSTCRWLWMYLTTGMVNTDLKVFIALVAFAVAFEFLTLKR